MKQSTALAILKTGKNVFLTGQAGAGKTYVLNQYIHYLRARGVPVAVTASTGIAATHMNGMTIHSWSGIGIHKKFDDVPLNSLKRKSEFINRITNTQVLIIDEISMLHQKQVDTIDQVLQNIRENKLPFGGMQVVFSGDFFQLPPVGEKGETSKEKYAFMSQAWIQSNFQVCYLSEQHRQAGNDEREKYGLSLNDILNQIRSQLVTHQAVNILKATQDHKINLNRTRLYTHNLDVDRINHRELDDLATKPYTYQAVVSGDPALKEAIIKGVRAPYELTLKIGARVMFVKNMPLIDVYNGTMGTVVSYIGESGKRYHDDHIPKHETAYPVVRLNNGAEILADPATWSIEDGQGEILASYTQVPLCLAWAITIHKSQGMTLDAAEIDLSKSFEMGQGYVALSRLRSLDGLKLLGFNTTSLLLDEWVQLVDRRFIELSSEHDQKFSQIDDKALTRLQEDFINNCGGTTNEKIIAHNEALLKHRQQSRARVVNQSASDLPKHLQENVYSQILELVKQGLSISQMAKKMALAEATVIKHLTHLSQQENLDLSAYRPDEQMILQVQSAYESLEAQGKLTGGLKLGLLHEELREKYAYNDIRLALIFIDKARVKDGVEQS